MYSKDNRGIMLDCLVKIVDKIKTHILYVDMPNVPTRDETSYNLYANFMELSRIIDDNSCLN